MIFAVTDKADDDRILDDLHSDVFWEVRRDGTKLLWTLYEHFLQVLFLSFQRIFHPFQLNPHQIHVLTATCKSWKS